MYRRWLVLLVATVILAAAFFIKRPLPVDTGYANSTSTPSGEREVAIYFSNSMLDPDNSCVKVFPVRRRIEDTPGVARAAILTLLAGPTLGEEKDGYFTNINPGVKIQSIILENGDIAVDFDETLDKNVGGSCRVTAIRSQIRETLLQFETVRNVFISVDGRMEDILQP